MTVNLLQHEEVKYRLRTVRSSLSQVAKILGCSKSKVTRTSQGYYRSIAIEQEIARQLNTPVEVVFSDRYPESATTKENKQ